jgi:hypothetical protein
MPTRPPKACLEPGCPALSYDGNARCPEHRRKQDRIWTQQIRDDPIAATMRTLYRSRRWQAVRRTVLRAQPWCAHEGCTELAVDVHHTTPLRRILEQYGDPYDLDVLTGLCKSHHARETDR